MPSLGEVQILTAELLSKERLYVYNKTIMSVKSYFSKSSDQIFIEGLEISCHVGVTAEERALQQILSLSITLDTPLHTAGASDKITDTINYAEVMDQTRNWLQGKTFSLIEKIAELTAENILTQFPVSRVHVLVSKLTLPGVKSVTVSIIRTKKQ